MIIGIDASRANREAKTGTEWYAYFLIRNFAVLDKDNQYILYTDKPLTGGLSDLRPEYDASSKQEEKIEYDSNGYQIIKSPHGNFKAKVLAWPLKYFWTLGGLSLEMLLRRPDVLFVPSHALPLVHPRCTIVTIHDIGFLKDAKLFAKDSIGADTGRFRLLVNLLVKVFTFGRYGANTFDYLRWSTRYALKHASRIISVSYFTKMELLNFYRVPEGKIKVVYNGYSKELYNVIENKQETDRILEHYGIEKPYIFYIGRLEKKKNITNLIEAYAMLRDRYEHIKHKLVLVGSASYGYDEIKYITREFDIIDEVIMPGWLDEEIIPHIYNGADLFVFPSRYEGFGIPLLEAMACGVPVAASRVTSIPEIAGDAAVYFHPDYALSISDAMYQALSDDSLRQANREKGLKRVTNFSWQKCAEETLQVIKDCGLAKKK